MFHWTLQIWRCREYKTRYYTVSKGTLYFLNLFSYYTVTLTLLNTNVYTKNITSFPKKEFLCKWKCIDIPNEHQKGISWKIHALCTDVLRFYIGFWIGKLLCENAVKEINQPWINKEWGYQYTTFTKSCNTLLNNPSASEEHSEHKL